VLPSGYPEVSPLIDQFASKLTSPTRYREEILRAIFPSQSGAAKMDFAPASGPFKQYADEAIIALAGDRAPFATGARSLTGPIGYKVVRVNVDSGKKQAVDFIRNTSGKPGSMSDGGWALERPIDAKFGPDGALYILDFGRMTVNNGKEKIAGGSGRVYRVVASERNGPATQPAVATHR
jgi:glucose/arabinose dehydrogenase